jgi:cation:H+ antiporter
MPLFCHNYFDERRASHSELCNTRFSKDEVFCIQITRTEAVGNVIGSNLFNILVVLGLTGQVAPRGIPVPPSALAFDLPVMMAVAVVCLPIFFIGGRISRWEGGLFCGYYVAYTIYIFLSATQHAALRTFQNVMLFFVLPLTAVTLLAMTVHTVRSNRRLRPANEAPESRDL